MRIAIVLTPPTDSYLRLAAQVGATDYVARYTTVDTPDRFTAEFERVSSLGLRLTVVEGYLPLDEVVSGGPGRDEQIAEIARLIRQMGVFGVPVLCYNFMQADWTRTSTQVPARGGALTNEFDLRAMAGKTLPPERCLSAEAMWENLGYFLEKLLPVAEESNVLLAMHPDDPPLPELMGSAQIMYSPACYDRLFADFPSPNNAMCFCQGTFAEMGGDIPELIRHFAGRIGYVHFRDVRGSARHFVETFHDEGQTDMFAAMRAYHEIGYAGVARPDHVPRLEGEEGDGSGYSMLGRLFAVGYMRGLIEAAEHPSLPE